MSHANSMAILNDHFSNKDESGDERIDRFDSGTGENRPIKSTYSSVDLFDQDPDRKILTHKGSKKIFNF